MMLLLLFLSGFEWTELTVSDPKDITSQIKQEIKNNFDGKEVINRMVYLDESVFTGGCKFLVPKGFYIKEAPNEMKLKKRYIKMVKYDRYSLTIREGKLEAEWRKLKSEFESVCLDGKSIESISKDKAKLMEYFPELLSSEEDFAREEKSREGRPEVSTSRNNQKRETFPEKTYFSFILIKKEYQEKLIPVILQLSPMESLIEKSVKEEE